MNFQNGTARVTASECHATCVYALLYGPSVTRHDGLALWGNAMVFVSVIIGSCAPTRNNQACISKRCDASVILNLIGKLSPTYKKTQSFLNTEHSIMETQKMK